MSARSNGSSRRWPWVLAIIALLLGLARTALAFRRDPTGLTIGLLAGLLLCGLAAAFGPRLYNRKIRRLTQLAAPGARVWACIDPEDPRAWRAVSVDEAGVSILGRKGTVRGPWPYEAIVHVGPGLVPAGLTQRGGVILRLCSGEGVAFLLPSRSTLSYPAVNVTACVAEICRRCEKTPQPDSSEGSPTG